MTIATLRDVLRAALAETNGDELAAGALTYWMI